MSQKPEQDPSPITLEQLLDCAYAMGEATALFLCQSEPDRIRDYASRAVSAPLEDRLRLYVTVKDYYNDLEMMKALLTAQAARFIAKIQDASVPSTEGEQGGVDQRLVLVNRTVEGFNECSKTTKFSVFTVPIVKWESLCVEAFKGGATNTEFQKTVDLTHNEERLARSLRYADVLKRVAQEKLGANSIIEAFHAALVNRCVESFRTQMTKSHNLEPAAVDKIVVGVMQRATEEAASAIPEAVDGVPPAAARAPRPPLDSVAQGTLKVCVAFGQGVGKA